MKFNWKKHLKDLFNLREWINALFFALIVAGIFRTFFFEPYKIPSASMQPTLYEGDQLFISKYSYGFGKYSFAINLEIPFMEGRVMFSPPERGDIVVFRGPHSSEIYIKRLVGFPGEKIQMKRGVLYINGTPVKREKYDSLNNPKLMRMQDRVRETLPNGVSYLTFDQNINFHMDMPDTTEVYEVPAKHYFVLGDNRNNSMDSRFLEKMGYIPEDNLLGKAQFLFWESDMDFLGILKGDTGRLFVSF